MGCKGILFFEKTNTALNIFLNYRNLDYPYQFNALRDKSLTNKNLIFEPAKV